jgi:hypothetical protein
MAETTKHDNAGDHEIWMRCFTAALAGSLAAGNTLADANNPEGMAHRCGRFADAALNVERERRMPGHQAL